MKELIAGMVAQLAVKESKIAAYLQRCSITDLVVADDGPVFFLESPNAYAVLLNNIAGAVLAGAGAVLQDEQPVEAA